jgi:hypothetical protein
VRRAQSMSARPRREPDKSFDSGFEPLVCKCFWYVIIDINIVLISIG